MSSKDVRKRTQSFKHEQVKGCSLPVMMNEESSYQNTQVYSKSKASLIKELTCMVMQSSHYIKSLPEVDLQKIHEKKVFLPYTKSNNCGTNLKSIIFDMDETLIHKIDQDDICKDADVYVDVPSEDLKQIYKVCLILFIIGLIFKFRLDSTSVPLLWIA